jgi:hypothetical protein
MAENSSEHWVVRRARDDRAKRLADQMQACINYAGELDYGTAIPILRRALVDAESLGARKEAA